MTNFVIMFVCLLAGQLIRRLGRFSIRDVRPLNTIILSLSLPAIVFVEVPSLFRQSGLNRELLAALGMPWCNYLFALVVIIAIAKWCGWSRKVVGALALTAGLGNTSFIGLPVIETMYGPAGLQPAIVIDQLGTFLILATLGLITASICSGRTLNTKVILKRVVLFPPFIAFILAVGWGLSSLPIEGIFTEPLKKIGATLVPLALLSVGWQLDLKSETLREYASRLGVGLALKLVLWPFIVLTLWSVFIGKTELVYNVTVIESAMAPMITGAVVAADFDLESELAQLMVGIGIPLSAATLYAWHLILKAV